MENTVKERLISFLRYKRITQRAFVTMLGLSGAYINSIRKSISPDVMLGIAKHFPELNRDWLLYGEGEMLKNESSSQTLSNVTNSGNMMVANNVFGNTTQINGNKSNADVVDAEEIPFVDVSIATKRGYDIQQAIMRSDKSIKQKTIEELFSPVTFMKEMYDNSMCDTIQQGDMIFVKFLPKDANIISGGIYLIDTNSYGTLVRQVYVNEDSFTLHALNTTYEDINIKRDDIFNFGRVVHSLRSSFPIPDNTISELAKESSKQISQLLDVISKQNDLFSKQNERFETERNKRDELLDYILRKTNQ